ncbi:MAG: YjbQ family protein [Chloroflexi bacterium]|nr:YjbQ family protein [Chloroflexota bacterium]
MIHRLSFRTRSKVEFLDITREIQNVVHSGDVKDGVCHIFVTHTTAGVILNEHADPNVAEDIAAQLESLAPLDRDYRHTEGNAAAHIRASLTGNSQVLFVEGGQLVMGTWQGIFLCEFDGPRNRTVLVKIVSDR